jgi:2,3-diketo-5-methylthiopentyl-1-phosphate enolase
MSESGYRYDLVVKNPESIDPDEHIIALWYLRSPVKDVFRFITGLALEQTTGTWVRSPAETDEVVEEYGGKVIGVYEVPSVDDKRTFIAQVAFPTNNIQTDVSQLLTFVIGNISMAAASGRSVKLIDLYLPKAWVSEFKGPKFGIEGVRELLKVPKRPLVNTMIKPCTGIPPEVHAKLFYEAAMGGVDILKDDELLACQKYCPPLDRVIKCREMIDKKLEQTGEKTLYTVNITTRTDKILEYAEKAIENGANALMLNSAAGFEALRMLAEDPSIQVPILLHPAIFGTVSASSDAGVAFKLNAKLARLCGADLLLFPAYYGKFPGWTKEMDIEMVTASRAPFYHIKRTLPGAGGGVHAGLVELAIKDFGLDQQIPAGGGVIAHPMGPRAGAISIRQAIDACINGIPLDEYAKEHKELKAALDKWGYVKSAEEAARLFDLKA